MAEVLSVADATGAPPVHEKSTGADGCHDAAPLPIILKLLICCTADVVAVGVAAGDADGINVGVGDGVTEGDEDGDTDGVTVGDTDAFLLKLEASA